MMTETSERPLPHNLEAERIVLGSILLDNSSFQRVADIVEADDFYRGLHHWIFDAMAALLTRAGEIDIVALKDDLNHSHPEAVAPAYLSGLLDGLPRSFGVEYYARIVKEKSNLRRLIFSANQILSTAHQEGAKADALLDLAEATITRIANDYDKRGIEHCSDACSKCPVVKEYVLPIKIRDSGDGSVRCWYQCRSNHFWQTVWDRGFAIKHGFATIDESHDQYVPCYRAMRAVDWVWD